MTKWQKVVVKFKGSSVPVRGVFMDQTMDGKMVMIRTEDGEVRAGAVEEITEEEKL